MGIQTAIIWSNSTALMRFSLKPSPQTQKLHSDMAIEAKTCIDMDNVEGLCKSLLSSIDKYRATTKELDRVRAVEAATNLTRSLEKPADAIYRLFLSVCLVREQDWSSSLSPSLASYSYGGQSSLGP